MGAADPTPVADTAIARDEADKKSLLSMKFPVLSESSGFPEL
jgi:hypothetical protein